MTRNKFISVLLLLFFSVVVVHNMIPHHHHTNVNISSQSDSCPVEQNDHNDTDGQTSHCIAFNELAFFKTSISEMSVPLSVISFLADFTIDPTWHQDDLSESKYFIPKIIPIRSRFTGDNISLRGPPPSC